MGAGEECDDAGESATCDADCTAAVCGDGVLNESAGETCDDGNTGTECLPGCVPWPPSVVFSEDFSDNSAGWALGTEWQIGPAVASPSPGSCGNGDPGTDHTPTADNGVAGANIGGNITTALHPFYYLTSPPFDASGYSDLELSLWRWLNSDYTPFMQNQIEVWDGAAWQIVWQSGGAPNIEDSAWNEQTYDISAYANAAMQIRIGYNVDSGGSFTCSGWNVDDIEIRTTNCTLACSGGADLVATSPGGDMVLCDDPTDLTCEQDFENLCPIGWELCTQPQQNNRNDGWNVPVGNGSSAALGEIHCRGGGGAGHFSVGPYDGITNLQQDAPLNCGRSSRAACPGAFGCNEQIARALCCLPTANCGNGIVDSPEEQCDDGNTDETDDCLDSCVWRVPTAHGLTGIGC